MEKEHRTDRTDRLIGLTLQLIKYEKDKLPISDASGHAVVLGHFDRIMIKPVERWLDFSPTHTEDVYRADKCEDNNATPAVSSYYPIKLLFPGESIESEYDIFQYDTWRSYENLLNKSPCMSLCLLNFTDNFKKEKGENRVLKDFQQILKEDSSISKAAIREASFCILPSLGYSDCCILMADQTWKTELELVEQLHSLRDGQNDPILSTDYLVPIFYDIRKMKNEERFFNGVSLSVNVRLRPGVTAKEFATIIQKEYTDIRVFRCTGSNDCIIQTNNPKSSSGLYYTLLTSELNSKIVLDLSTSIYLLRDKEETENETHPLSENYDEIKKTIGDFNTAIKDYAEQLRLNHRHLRQANALKELSASVLSTCCRPHSSVLTKVFKAFLRDFAWCLECCSKKMKAEGVWDFDLMEVQVSELCSSVTGFIADISRSDNYSMEYEKYLHASVGSSTKLLLAFNHWLINLNKCICESTEKNSSSEHTFLVTSGGRDQSEAFSAFQFLEPEKDSTGNWYEKQPILTQLPEMSLLDFSGTILRCFHECLHYCGERYRRERLKYMVGCTAEILSQNIANALFPKLKAYGDAERNYLFLNPTGKSSDPILVQAESIYWSYYGQLQREIKNALCKAVVVPKNEEEPFFFLKNVKSWLYEEFMVLLSGYEDSTMYPGGIGLPANAFIGILYQAGCDTNREFFTKIRDLFAPGIGNEFYDTSIYDFEINKQVFFGKYTENETDKLLVNRIQLILSRLLFGDLPDDIVVLDRDSAEFRRWMQHVPYIDLCSRNLWKTIDVVTAIFTEAFSDAIACWSLNVSLEDYVISMIFEGLTLDTELRRGDDTITYRVGAVLKLLFNENLTPDQKSLNQEAKIGITRALDYLNKHGKKEGNFTGNVLCDRVDAILADYADNSAVGRYLYNYLQFCLEEYKKTDITERIAMYREKYEKIRLITVDPQESAYYEKLIEMFYVFISIRG